MPYGLWKAFFVFWALALAATMVLIALGSELMGWAFAAMMGFGLLTAYGCYGVKGLLNAWPLALIGVVVSAGLLAHGTPAVLVGALTGVSERLWVPVSATLGTRSRIWRPRPMQRCRVARG